MTGKQRAFLRSMCNEMPAILYVGKEGVTEAFVQSVSEALAHFNEIPFEDLKEAITDLRSVVEPLANITNVFR